MANFDSSDLYTRVTRYINRPTSDELVTPTLVYALLSEAQTEILGELATLAPASQMGAPVLMTSADGGVTYTFGTDADGNDVFPLACEIYAEIDGREWRACSWTSWGDFVPEGNKVRMPGNVAQTITNGPYARFVAANASITSVIQPVLNPPAARMLIVYKALVKFAAIGAIRDPKAWQDEYDKAWKTWVTALRTQFADSAGVANEGLTRASWWNAFDTTRGYHT